MARKDVLLAMLVVVAWGLNFVVIKVGLHSMPPLLLAGLRFVLVAFPALLFVARPKIPLHLLLGYGLTISFGNLFFCFAPSSLACPRGLHRWCYRRRHFYHHPWRGRVWRTLTGETAGRNNAGYSRRAGAD